MSQSPAVAWDPAPIDTKGALAGGNIGAAVAPVVEVKVESFEEKVESSAREQIATIKMSTDQTRLNAAVSVRVKELVKELGLPPPRTEEENIQIMVDSKLDEFEGQRLNFMAEKKAREIFFDRHPEMKTQEKKQNVHETTQAMSEALFSAFLRFLRDEQQADQRREAREAARKKPA